MCGMMVDIEGRSLALARCVWPQHKTDQRDQPSPANVPWTICAGTSSAA